LKIHFSPVTLVFDLASVVSQTAPVVYLTSTSVEVAPEIATLYNDADASS